MTIDKAIKWLEYRAECCDAMDAYSVKCEYEDVAELIKELKWYREQDLIKRDDVIEELGLKWCGETECIYTCQSPCGFKVVMDIPKAEPSVAKDINALRNGDCETCKHYSEDWFDCDTCGENNLAYYEPYIPKE